MFKYIPFNAASLFFPARQRLFVVLTGCTLNVSSACQVRDLDAALSGPQRAEVLAFTQLAAARLEAATLVTTWLEGHSYDTYTRVCRRAGRGLAAWSADSRTMGFCGMLPV